jgi:predicted nucleotidyltransferase
MVATEVKIPEAFQPDIERAVKILKDGGCTEVFLFGSLAEGCSRPDSDIDLAVRGCPPRAFFRIYGELMDRLEHKVDLVDLDVSHPFTKYLAGAGEMLRLD